MSSHFPDWQISTPTGNVIITANVFVINAHTVLTPNTFNPPGGVNTSVQFNDSGLYGGVANLTYNKVTNVLSLGNSTVNVSTNSTNFSGTANNTLFVGTIAQANVVSNAQLIANLANYTNTATLNTNFPNTTQLAANLANYTNTAVLSTNYPNTVQLAANLANYTNTAVLSATYATLLANATFANVTANQIFVGSNTNNVAAILGYSNNNFAISGTSNSNVGVIGNSNTGVGAEGVSFSSTGVVGVSTSGVGVEGISNSQVGVVGISNTSFGGEFISNTGTGLYVQSNTANVMAFNNAAGQIGWMDNTGRLTLGNTTVNTAINSTSISTLSHISPYPLFFKNRLINGDHSIDQIRESGTNLQGTNASYIDDQHYSTGTITSKFTTQRNRGAVTPPTGFLNYMGANTTTAYTVLSTDTFGIVQPIEGPYVSDLAFGSASAQTMTLSFWAYSNLTGNFGAAIRNGAKNRSYPFLYNIPVASTWTKIVVTFPGDTTGTWNTGVNTTGMDIFWCMGAGSNFLGTANTWAANNYTGATGAQSILGTLGNLLYIGGEQLELGSIATPFERRPIPLELALCQRYFEKSYSQGTPIASTSTAAGGTFAFLVYAGASALTQIGGCVAFKVTKMVQPTLTGYSEVTGTSGKFRDLVSSTDITAQFTLQGDTGFSWFGVASGVSATIEMTAQWTAASQL